MSTVTNAAATTTTAPVMTAAPVSAAAITTAAPATTAQVRPTPIPTAAAPSVHRRALITWLAIYPSVTAVFLVIGPLTAHLPIPLRTLILTAIVVPTVVYVLLPRLLKANARVDAAVSARRARRSGGA